MRVPTKKFRSVLTWLVLVAMLATMLITAQAAQELHPVAIPFDGTGAELASMAGESMAATAAATVAVAGSVDIHAAMVAGADYLQHAQADVTEDNAGNGDPDLPNDPDDGGWDWRLTSPAFTHSTAASPPNIYGATAMGLYYAYLETSDAGHMTAMLDAADVMAGDANIRSASDLVFLMRFQDLPGVAANTYQDAAKAKFDGRIATYGTATALAQYIRDARHGQGYDNGIIPWDIGTWAVAAQMLEDRYPSDPYDYATAADDIAEVIWQDSFNSTPGYFDPTTNNGWDPTYANTDYYWYTLGITGLIDAFEAANVHTSEISGLVTTLLECQYDGGAFSYSYGANTDDEDWQSTAYAVMSLARVDQATYQSEINLAGYWLAATQDSSGGWVYSSGNHYPEIGGENTAALSFAEVPSTWVKYSGNPVVTGSMAFDPSVINDGGTYKMWYTHVDNSGVWSIYYATSTDGITWTPSSSPVLQIGSSGDFDELRVIGPTVVKDGPTDYKMWYSGKDSAGVYSIGYATSTDGIVWSKYATTPVLNVGPPGSWESAMVREPWVINDGGTYKMWYEGAAIWPQFQIGYATSPDGITWTKHGSNPVLSGTASGWDGFQVYAPSVVKDGGTYHMYYSGTDNDYSQRWSTGYATSADGIAWTKAVRNPVLLPDGSDDSADYVSAMNDGGTWKMWFSYGGSYAIGLATLTSGTQLWLDPAVASIPNDHTTTQTYTVYIDNAVNMYGFQFVITFDPANLEATAAAWDNSFFSTPQGSPSTWDAHIDNTSGKVYFARTRENPQTAVWGSGSLATVTFRSTSSGAAGTYKLDFAQNILSDIDGTPLSHTTQYAWLSLYGQGNLQGTVDLQGRSDESGGTVSIVSAAGYSDSTTVAADGSWSFTSIPAASYQVNVEMARYLDGQKGDDGGLTNGVTVTGGGTTTLNQVKLLGGDANDTIKADATTPNPAAGAADVIDILDAGIIGGTFGLSGGGILDIRADINNDVAVDILDLSLMGGNFSKTSPVPWP